MDYKSITNSTYVDEGMEALRLAKEYEDKRSLKDNFDINKFSKSARNNCWNKIDKRYLSRSDGRLNFPLISLIDYKDFLVNKELMFYHYLHREPIFKKTILELVYPRIESSEEYIIKSKDILLFISDYLDYAESTMKKTASSIKRALVDFEIAEAVDNQVKVKKFKPQLLSVVFAFYSEYAAGFEEAKRFNILNPSVEHIVEKAEFYKLFLMDSSNVEGYLQRAWKEDYLGYEPRGGLNQYVLRHKSLDELIKNCLYKK